MTPVTPATPQAKLEYGRRWRQQNPTAQRKAHLKWYSSHAEVVKAKARARYHNLTMLQKLERLAKHRMRQHGVSADWYRDQLVGQAGRCAICGKVMDPGRKGTHIDHDHVTDEPRGLLCPNCNLLLGHAHDSAEILAKAISYLTRS